MIVISGFIEVAEASIEGARAAVLPMMTESGKEESCFCF